MILKLIRSFGFIYIQIVSLVFKNLFQKAVIRSNSFKYIHLVSLVFKGTMGATNDDQSTMQETLWQRVS